MIEGVLDSLYASVIGKSVKYLWYSEYIRKIRYVISNPEIYIKYTYLKKYDNFSYDFREIKKLIFNNNAYYHYLNKIVYSGHGKNYLTFTIKDSGSSYRLEITSDVDVENLRGEFYDESPCLVFKVKSISPSISKYRDCGDITDLKIINLICSIIEKKYNLNSNFEFFELISSCDENMDYPKGNVIKEKKGMNQIIYDEKSMTIKSRIYDDLIRCLEKNKFKLFKN